MDFITELPPRSSHAWILVIVDWFAKATEFIICDLAMTAEGTVRLFLDYVYRHHGLPWNFINGRVNQFTSKFWNAIMCQLA